MDVDKASKLQKTHGVVLLWGKKTPSQAFAAALNAQWSLSSTAVDAVVLCSTKSRVESDTRHRRGGVVSMNLLALLHCIDALI